MSRKKRIWAFIFAFLGGLLCLTGIGAIIGIPMILLGIGFYANSIKEETGEKPWWAKSMIPGVGEEKDGN